ncbi:unnamed protein product, partial [Tenebrio molitor]
PRIIAQDGNLIFYAAEHKNISLQTQGRGGIHVNGIDLHQAAKTLLDHQSFPKISNKANTSSEIPVNSLVSTFLMSIETGYKILLVCSTQC